MTAEITFGDRLAAWLRRRRLSQSEFSRRCGVDRSTVNLWVHDKRVPSHDAVVRVAATLRIRLHTFFGPLPRG